MVVERVWSLRNNLGYCYVLLLYYIDNQEVSISKLKTSKAEIACAFTEKNDLNFIPQPGVNGDLMFPNK